MKKIELLFTKGREQEQFLLQNEAVLLGSAPNCRILVEEDGGPPIKAIIQRKEDEIFIGVFDPEIKIVLFGQEHSQVTLKDSSFFAISDITFAVNFSEDADEVVVKTKSVIEEKTIEITDVHDITQLEVERMSHEDEEGDDDDEDDKFEVVVKKKESKKEKNKRIKSEKKDAKEKAAIIAAKEAAEAEDEAKEATETQAAEEADAAAKVAEQAADEAEQAAKEAEEAAIETKAAEDAAKEAEQAAKDAEQASKEAEIAAKEAEIALKETEIAAKEAEIEAKEVAAIEARELAAIEAEEKAAEEKAAKESKNVEEDEIETREIKLDEIMNSEKDLEFAAKESADKEDEEKLASDINSEKENVLPESSPDEVEASDKKEEASVISKVGPKLAEKAKGAKLIIKGILPEERAKEEPVKPEEEMPSLLFGESGLELPRLVEDHESTNEIQLLKELLLDSEPEVKKEVAAAKPVVKAAPVMIDGEECDIVFDESQYFVMFDLPVKEKFDYSGYNDPYDTKTESNLDELFEPVTAETLQISHLNNGVLLDTDFFSLEESRIFLSNSRSSKNYFKVHDLKRRKFELVFVRDNKIFVSCPQGYVMTVVVDNELKKVSKQTIVFPVKGRVVLSKGTSQIIIKKTDHPPRVIGTDFFDVDQQLVKTQAIAWAIALLMILLVWIIGDIPSLTAQKKKEVVVIYKRKLKKDVQKKKVAKVAPAKNKPKKDKPKPKTAIKKKKKTKVKKRVAKKMTPKKAPKPKTKVATSRKVAPKVAVKKVVKKSYNFNISSQLKSTVGSSKSHLATVKSSKAYTTQVTKGTTQNSAVAAANVSAQGVSSKGFNAGELSALNATTGTAGLASGKSGTASAYVETSTKVLGAIDPELIRKLLREHIPQFRYCYQKELNAGNEKLKGVFDINFKINSRGNGSSVRVVAEGARFSKAGVKCISKVIGMIKFPKPKGGGVVDVRQPMNFFSNKSNL